MKTVSLLLACLALPLAALAAAPPRTTVFVNATVLPMDSERTLAGQTVVVRGARIVEVGPVDRIKIPAGAEQIDATGKFLLPGLGEMHGHNPPPGSTPEYIESVYFLYVANGVTTVRSMLGWPGQLELREKVRTGEMVGPTLLLAGPSFSGQTVPSPQVAAQRVREQKAEGWDLLKVHPGLKREVFDAMAATAHEVGIEFSGHIPADVGLTHAIERGITTVDHLDGYIELLKADAGPIDPAKLAEVVRLTRDTGTWVVPTMALWEHILGASPLAEIGAYPELKYLPANLVENWRSGYEKRTSAPNFNLARAKQIAANRKVLLKALADGRTRIIFGTDAPQIFSVPGFSIHREFKAMAEVGMSNYAILESATKRVGEYLAKTDKFGTIAAGQRADILLLTANPLSDLKNVEKRAGVMLRGRWLPESEIQSRLQAIAAQR